MDKYSLGKKIKEAEEFTDEEKSELLRLLRTHKRYGLVWEEKTEDVEERLRDELPVLREVKQRAIVSGDADAPNHILIEGDNLEALTTLAYTHAGKIDVIYIDPPYNTGNKDFVYNDRYVDSEDSYRHSKWLSFMHKRLKIAKQLLSDKGVIFISIDNNEFTQLKLLCDEVFGERNFIGALIWRKKSGGGQTDEFFVTEHEYIYGYRISEKFEWKNFHLDAEDASYKYEDNRGKFKITKLEKWGSSAHKEDRPTMYFPIKDPDGQDFYPIAPDGKDGRWRVGKSKIEALIATDHVYWLKKPKGWVPYEKQYFDAANTSGKLIKSRSILYDVAETGTATKLLTSIFNTKDIFSNPKPIELVSFLLMHVHCSTILDFFAGSGTTMHATMQLNAEDGGRRQCILVTNNENNICEEVTYERNKRVIEGYTTPKGEAVEGLKGNNLRYYKTEFVSRDRTARNMRRLTNLATDMLCIKEDIYAEQSHFGRHRTRQGTFRHFVGGERSMLVVYREEAIEELVDELRGMQPATPVCVYVFSPSEDPWRGMFEDVMEKVELCALPQAIYNAYRRILPKRRDAVVCVKPQEAATAVSEEQ